MRRQRIKKQFRRADCRLPFPVFHDDAEHIPRIVVREKSDEKRMDEVVTTELRGTGFRGDGVRGGVQLLRRPVRHRLAHPFPHDIHDVLRHPQMDPLPVPAMGEMRTHEIPAVHESCGRPRELQGGHLKCVLPDDGVVGVAEEPVLAVYILLPFPVRYGAGRFMECSDGCRGSESEQVRVPFSDDQYPAR